MPTSAGARQTDTRISACYRMRPQTKILFLGGKDYIPLFCNCPPRQEQTDCILQLRPSARCARLRADEVRDIDKDELALRVCEPRSVLGRNSAPRGTVDGADCRARGKLVGWGLPTAATETR